VCASSLKVLVNRIALFGLCCPEAFDVYLVLVSYKVATFTRVMPKQICLLVENMSNKSNEIIDFIVNSTHSIFVYVIFLDF
jgi:hypothetical protein